MGSVLVLPAQASQGTALFLGADTSPATFSTPLGRIGNIDFNGISVDVVDVSNQTSHAHRMLGTLLKPGDMNFVLYWIPDSVQDQQLFELILTYPPPLRSWQVQWPDGTIWQFNAYLTKFPPKADIGKALEAACTLTIDDQIYVTQVG